MSDRSTILYALPHRGIHPEFVGRGLALSVAGSTAVASPQIAWRLLFWTGALLVLYLAGRLPRGRELL
jgi:hypothetical protein